MGELGEPAATDLYLCCVFACASLDHMSVVREGWSHVHAQSGLVLACRAVQAVVEAWNAEHGALGYAVVYLYSAPLIHVSQLDTHLIHIKYT
jgi:hypothetical protein